MCGCTLRSILLTFIVTIEGNKIVENLKAKAFVNLIL